LSAQRRCVISDCTSNRSLHSVTRFCQLIPQPNSFQARDNPASDRELASFRQRATSPKRRTQKARVLTAACGRVLGKIRHAAGIARQRRRKPFPDRDSRGQSGCRPIVEHRELVDRRRGFHLRIRPNRISTRPITIRQRIFSEAEAAHRDERRHGMKSASASLKIL
jgi:hypothetical protein